MCVHTGLTGAEVSRKAPASERTCCGACWIASSASPGTTTCWVDRHSESTCCSGRIGNNTEIRFFARKFISLYRITPLGTFTKDGQKNVFPYYCRISLKTLNSCLFSTLSEPFTKPFALKLILFEFVLVPRFFVQECVTVHINERRCESWHAAPPCHDTQKMNCAISSCTRCRFAAGGSSSSP